MTRRTIYRKSRVIPLVHAHNHGPGPCDQCALEMARADGSQIFHVGFGQSEDGKLETAIIQAENRVATQAEIRALIAACYQHLKNITDENAAALDQQARELAEKEAESSMPGERIKRPTPPGFVYVMVNHANGFYKIGFSSRPKFREETLASQEPLIELLATTPGTKGDEAALHEEFAAKRLRGEWFTLTEVDVEELKWRWGV